jgi:hypothetical protein
VALHNEQDIENIVARHNPGDQVKLIYRHRNAQVETNLKLKGNTTLNVVSIDRGNTTGEEKLKSDWQSSKAR